MRSASFLLFAPLTLARAGITPRASYADATVSLRKDLLSDWYSELDSDDSDSEGPNDPAGFYSCAGPMIEDYPQKNEWLSFKTMWAINEPDITMPNGCDSYNTHLREAIAEISVQSKVDARLILTLVLQEVWRRPLTFWVRSTANKV